MQGGEGVFPPINLLCPWADHLLSLGLNFLIYKVSDMDYGITYCSLIVAAFYLR